MAGRLRPAIERTGRTRLHRTWGLVTQTMGPGLSAHHFAGPVDSRSGRGAQRGEQARRIHINHLISVVCNMRCAGARGRRRAGGSARRSRGNVCEHGVRCRADQRRPVRSRGNAGAGARFSGRGRPDRTGRGGRHPRFRGDGAPAGLRRCHGEDATRSRRQDSGRRPQDADDLASAATGAGGARPAVPVSRVPESPLRRAPHSALGRWRRNEGRQPGAVMPIATYMF